MKILLLDSKKTVTPAMLGKIRGVLEAHGVSVDTIDEVPLKDHPERVGKALDLIEQMARMTCDGERTLDNGDIQEDPDAVMENDDAVETVSGLIRSARELAVNPPRVLEAVEEA